MISEEEIERCYQELWKINGHAMKNSTQGNLKARLVQIFHDEKNVTKDGQPLTANYIISQYYKCIKNLTDINDLRKPEFRSALITAEEWINRKLWGEDYDTNNVRPITIKDEFFYGDEQH